jgi:hypothetical protein
MITPSGSPPLSTALTGGNVIPVPPGTPGAAKDNAAAGTAQSGPVTGPAVPLGWQCPLCRQVYSPAIAACWNCTPAKAGEGDG